MKRLICCLKDRRGSSFPFVIAVTLVLMLIMCGFLEFYRLKIIANGVRDAAQEAIMITVNDNYANVYTVSGKDTVEDISPIMEVLSIV